jgi:hypothetical protein
MPRQFKGVIDLDTRKSKRDCEPFRGIIAAASSPDG